jgi:hypothetical protein
LGQCSFRDYEMIAPGGDSSRLAFRSSWAVALRALRRAVDLNPSYDRAYRPLFAILFAETRDGCSSATGVCSHVAPNVRDGDSVITIPRLVPTGVGIDPYDDVLRETQAKGRGNLVEARALAERWAGVAPNDPRPHEYFGRALLRLGDAAPAANELERAASLGDAAGRRSLFWDRIEALIKADRGNDARHVLDEAVSDPGRDTLRLRDYAIAGLNSLLGRNRPPPVDSNVMRRNRVRFDSMARSRPTFPPPRPSVSQLAAAGDTAAARHELVRFDSILAPPVGGLRFSRARLQFASASSHLIVADTAGAEARLAAIDQILSDRPLQYSGVMYDGGPWIGHAWMLAGNLAAARHRFPEAARMYRRIVGLWGGGDPDLQPLVVEARAKLESLPAR